MNELNTITAYVERVPLAMVKANYPYLDLTVLPQIRPHVLTSSAAALFDKSLERVLWANGEGTRLVGAPSIRDLLEGDVELNKAMMRQISSVARKLTNDEDASAFMRVPLNFKTQLIGFSLRRIDLPGDETAILLLTERLHGRRHSERDMAQVAVNCFDGYSNSSAILEEDGQIFAASEYFHQLDVSTEELAALASEVSSEADRLVKRPIDTKDGPMPAGIARLADNPARHMLIISNVNAASGTSETDEQAEDDTATLEDTAQETTDGEPKVGAFSNRRNPIGNPPNKWYYKSLIDPDADDEEWNEQVLDDEREVQPARSDSSETGDKILPAEVNEETPKERPSALIQDIEHTPLEAASPSDIDAESDEFETGDQEDDGFRFTAGSKPIRFVWELTADNEFRSVSPEFAQAVGKKSANIEGLTWEEVGQLFNIENADEVSSLLKKGDTWSGKTVSWPVDNTDLRVPIDLAGLPSYDRNRAFAGFNGFGIIRTADAMIDPGFDAQEPDEPILEDDFGTSEEIQSETTSDESSEIEELSNNVEVFAPNTMPSGEQELPSILDGEEKRGTSLDNRTLSLDEQENFEEIGETLSDGSNTAALDENLKAFEADEIEDSPSQTPTSTKSKSNIPDHTVDTSILARLPIPVLVYRDNDLLFGNQEFFELTGYDDLRALAEAGGIESLFGSPLENPENTQAQIFHRNGNKLDVHAHLQRVPWDVERAMLLTLRQDEGSGNDGTPDAENMLTTAPRQSKTNSPGGQNSGPASTLATKTKRASITQLRPVSATAETDLATQTDPFGGIAPEDLRSILDTATDGVIILSDEGVVRAINQSAEALFDIDPNKIIDQNFTKLLAPESRRSALDYVSGIAGTGVASILNDGREVIGKTTRGGLIPLFMTIGKMDKTDACCVVVRDITQWKKSEEELVTARSEAEMANAQKTEFLTKVSHEIRTPLNAIIGFSNLMISERFGKIDNDRYRGYLRDINHSGTHMLDLINDLLDISKIEAGKMELSFDACELVTIVSETVALTQPEANKERVIIRTSLSSAVPKVVADPRSLKQIILNLVSNSIKHTKSGGQVIISTVYEESGEVVLRVRDTGVGMSELELAKALKPFQQVGDDSDSSKQGTGLGLPLTKAMVEANRAKFHIESKPDEGTLVEIRFPSQRVLADR